MDAGVDDEPYFQWVDELSSRGDQLQSNSQNRASLDHIGVDGVILFLCGGIASGLLARYGELVADWSVGLFKWLAKRRGDASTTLESDDPVGPVSDTALESVGLILQVVSSTRMQTFAQAILVTDLIERGLDVETAQEVASNLLAPARTDEAYE